MANDLDAPADLGYPLSLPLEVAMGDKPVREIFEDYGLSRDDYDRLRRDPIFVMDVQRFREELKKDGMSFRLKAKMQADYMLRKAWIMIDEPATPATVKADLLKSVVRWAGYEQKAGVDPSQIAGGPAFQINFIMSDGG